jgi:integrase
MKSYQVNIWDTRVRTLRGKTRYRVRWTVRGSSKPFEELFRTKALADTFRSRLVTAARDGEAFDTITGRPISEVRARNTTTWYAHARAYVAMKWPRLAAKSRRSTTEALTTITVVLLRPSTRGRPDDMTLRRALYFHGLNPRPQTPPREYAAALEWLDQASLPVVELDSPALVRRTLDALCMRLDGKPAAATTVQRKRAVLYNALGYAVELGLLDSNPIDRVQWTAPEVAPAIDRRTVANPNQVTELLKAVRDLGDRADRHTAFFGCLYYAGTRPAEAADLRWHDCHLPARCLDCNAPLDLLDLAPDPTCAHQQTEPGWGRITLAGTAPRAGSHWTDDGRPNERRGLKHRARTDTRPVPIPPQLVTLLYEHITRHGTATDGRLFRGLHGGPLSESVYDRWWKFARSRVLTPAQLTSPLARRPYDLRHAAASLWLNAGVPATEVARRLGHSVAVLLRVYVNCIDQGDDGHNERIGGALG